MKVSSADRDVWQLEILLYWIRWFFISFQCHRHSLCYHFRLVIINICEMEVRDLSHHPYKWCIPVHPKCLQLRSTPRRVKMKTHWYPYGIQNDAIRNVFSLTFHDDHRRHHHILLPLYWGLCGLLKSNTWKKNWFSAYWKRFSPCIFIFIYVPWLDDSTPKRRAKSNVCRGSIR